MKRGRVPREPSSVSPSRRCDFQSWVRGQRTPEERGVLLRRRICDCCPSSRPTFRTGHGTRSLLIWRERESAAARPRAQCLVRRPRPATAGRGAGFGSSVRTSRSRVHGAEVSSHVYKYDTHTRHCSPSPGADGNTACHWAGCGASSEGPAIPAVPRTQGALGGLPGRPSHVQSCHCAHSTRGRARNPSRSRWSC